MNIQTDTWPIPLEERNWRKEYARVLGANLERASAYVLKKGMKETAAHLRSFLGMLKEARSYPELMTASLELIRVLNPLPFKSGQGYLWEGHILFALEQTGGTDVAGAYHTDLADYYLAVGSFKRALTHAKRAYRNRKQGILPRARAVRTFFNALRITGEVNRADELIREALGWWSADSAVDEKNPQSAMAWMAVNQCQFELLREKGQNHEALTLSNELVDLNERLGQPDAILTADMLTARSTLEWTLAMYKESVADLQEAIRVYRSAGDEFTAQSLSSNLGLVYWTMGELNLAEEELRSALEYYRRVGSEHLRIYDLGNMGLVYSCRGDFERAEGYYRQQIELAKKLGFPSEAYRGDTNLADIFFHQKKYAVCIELHLESGDYYSKRGSREGYGIGMIYCSLSAYHLGKEQEARQTIKETLQWSQDNRMVILESVAHRAYASILPVEERAPHLNRALEISRACGRVFEAAACLFCLIPTMTDEEQRRKTWQEGERILERIGATLWCKGRSIDDPPFLFMGM